MNAIQQDIERNRAMLRQSHARLTVKAGALLAMQEVREAKTCSPLWHASVALEVATESAERVEHDAAQLLERLSSLNEEEKS